MVHALELVTPRPLMGLVRELSRSWDLLEAEEIAANGWGSQRWFAIMDHIAMLRHRIEVWW